MCDNILNKVIGGSHHQLFEVWRGEALAPSLTEDIVESTAHAEQERRVVGLHFMVLNDARIASDHNHRIESAKDRKVKLPPAFFSSFISLPVFSESTV